MFAEPEEAPPRAVRSYNPASLVVMLRSSRAGLVPDPKGGTHTHMDVHGSSVFSHQ
jgi:hypothetical protein